jgi:hypothetical protein
MKRIWIALVLTVAVAATGIAGEKKDGRKTLAEHETVATFTGAPYRLCMGRTMRCPKTCGDSGEIANFKIVKYLRFVKHGKYGGKQKAYYIQISDFDRKPKGDPAVNKTIAALKPGDYLLLSWNHDYVTRNGSSFPVRPLLKLEKITKEKAEELMKPPEKNK